MRPLLVFLAVAALASAEPPKLALSTAKADPPKELAEAIAKLLDQQAVSVTSDAAVSLTLWFRAELPTAATAEQIKNGLTYREIPEGTLLGVVKFEKAFTDFRKQEIPAGVYTLRLAVQPDTGDHTDTAPHQDFALLLPAASDTTADAIEVQQAVKLSLKATGGDHPAVMLLYPHHGKEEKAEVVTQKEGPRCVRLRRSVANGDKKTTLGVSVVVDGYSKTR
ncbi:MAG: hypothetical protein MUF18_05195 [Fimbriiglobus sp.]|nr:hypothetical protein [Fimbriiglobus sp.]